MGRDSQPSPDSGPHCALLPNCAELERRYDVDRMRADLAAFTARSGSPFSAASGRRVLPLRSIAGDPYRTDSGGPSLTGFQDTPWLRHLPYFREILRGLPAPVRAARLWAAGPGGRDMTLRSAKLGPSWGLCRVHIPVVSGPWSQVVFFAERHHWPAGSLWFAAAWREYAVVNQGDRELIHLVVDLHQTKDLSALFPRPLRGTLAGPHALRLRPPVPLPEPQAFLRRFRLPESFANWERPGHLLYAEARRLRSAPPGALVPAEVAYADDGPVLVLADRPFCGLEHIGGGEFRLRGWSDERTLQFTGPPDAAVLLRLRDGPRTYRVALPTAPVANSAPAAD
ncbi:hypothetical protein ACFU5O_16475 [Streptomyces sp. NPDC057445]|uniref:hypothetical protein n=1 Tax=Streptomyces sp. NPDC057445 TaxID=3346136 RepID=UPI00368FD635